MQQVNLLTALPKPEKVFFPFRQIVTVCGGLIVLLMLVALFNIWDIAKVKTRLGTVKNEKTTASQTLIQLKQKYPTELAQIQIKQKIEALEKELADKKQHLGKIHKLIQAHAFAKYFIALASATPSGAWLTQIIIDNDRDSITLKGKVLNPNVATQFLADLRKTAVFKNTEFTVFRINKSADKNGTIDFEFSTKNHEQT